MLTLLFDGVAYGMLLFILAIDIIISWLLLRQADIAAEKLPTATGKDADFYTGKIASAKFFVSTVLPHITADRKIVEATDGAIMDIAEGAF
jgi:hypothetical protein